LQEGSESFYNCEIIQEKLKPGRGRKVEGINSSRGGGGYEGVFSNNSQNRFPYTYIATKTWKWNLK
jgi:hypothetical protein